jgi:hypothetical protein
MRYIDRTTEQYLNKLVLSAYTRAPQPGNSLRAQRCFPSNANNSCCIKPSSQTIELQFRIGVTGYGKSVIEILPLK